MRAQTNTRNDTSKVANLAAKRKQLSAKRREMAKRSAATNVVKLPVGRTNGDRSALGVGARVEVDSAAPSPNALNVKGPAEKIERVADTASTPLHQFSRTGAAVSQGVRDISREWLSWARARAHNSQQGFMALMQCRSPQELFEVQSRMLSQNLALLTASAKRMIDISSEMTSKVSPRITPTL
jgi:hypothetical protein